MNIIMPRLGVNDDFVTLVTWRVKDGDWIEAGTIVADIETSKEASEVKAEISGVIHIIEQAGSEIEVGKVIASIGEVQATKPKEIETALTQPRMTEKARKLIEENNIELSLLPVDKLIKEKDVLPFIKKKFHIGETHYNDLLLYGGGGFTEIAIDILKITHAYRIVGIVDMKFPELKEVMGVPVIGGDEQLQELYEAGYHKIFNGVGANGSQYWRKPPYEKIKKFGFEFPNIVHPRAILEPSVSLGEGSIICAGAIIGANARIGNNCVINAGSIISHDCIISDNCHICSGAVLAGIVNVGENTLVGQNVTVYSRVNIGSNVVVENGCNIFKNVQDNTIVRYK